MLLENNHLGGTAYAKAGERSLRDVRSSFFTFHFSFS